MSIPVIPEALTFDDVLLVPAYSEILPSEAQLTTHIAPGIRLKTPIISSAMDTVTEAEMAISMAREGGLGVIHKNMTIEEQRINVIKVKRTENGVIRNPVVLDEGSSVAEAKDIMEKFNISGILIVNKAQQLKGILTNRDLRYFSEQKKLVSDIMTKENLVVVREGIAIEAANDILAKNKIEKLPITDEAGYVRGLITMKDIRSVLQYPDASKDEEGRLQVGAAIGNTPDVMDRVAMLIEAGVDLLVLDSAHGHSKSLLDLIVKIRKSYTRIPIMAGNIVTAGAAQALAEAGADAVKVGIGPGSICTTRVIAGVGMPQVSAIMEVAAYCREHNVYLVADGGIRFSGDIVKALAVGADAVMLGGLLAGTEEAPGEDILFEGRKFKSYIGMGSIKAMGRGSSDRYFQAKSAKKLVPEGIESRVPYRGLLQDVLFQLCGGVRSGMGYCGAETIKDLQKKARLVRVTGAGMRENHPHSVVLTKEAPNYSALFSR